MNGVGPIEMLLIVAMSVVPFMVVLVAILWLVDRARRGRQSAPRPDPREILTERLALGQITPDEFETAMRALGYGDRERP